MTRPTLILLVLVLVLAALILLVLVLVLAACPWPGSPPAPPSPPACVVACEAAWTRCAAERRCPGMGDPACSAHPNECTACHRPCAAAFKACTALCTIPDLTSVRGG